MPDARFRIKTKNFLTDPASRNQNLASAGYLHHNMQKLDINFKILANEDG
jgi:hypothetical protein